MRTWNPAGQEWPCVRCFDRHGDQLELFLIVARRVARPPRTLQLTKVSKRKARRFRRAKVEFCIARTESAITHRPDQVPECIYCTLLPIRPPQCNGSGILKSFESGEMTKLGNSIPDLVELSCRVPKRDPSQDEGEIRVDLRVQSSFHSAHLTCHRKDVSHTF